MCVYAMRTLMETRRGHWILLELKLQAVKFGCWDLKLGPLEEQ